ncbi:MAG TPA: prepilin-type N-terminal cleavage/methylation domain-containing protein [Lacunisphaera sp.]|nr:prepilin-type N-terminal cleavage/methylation domain-containing protein [Lacunisphaera sp.]
MMAARHHHCTGFTLIEVMMASAILVVGFTGLIHGITIGSEALDTSRKQQVATQIMDAEIERLRSGPWSTIAGLAASGALTISDTGALSGDPTLFALTNYTVVSSDDNTALIALAKGFTCSYVLTRLRPASATSSTVTYLRIDYTVSWTSNTGRVYRRSTPAFFGQNGLHLSYQKS